MATSKPILKAFNTWIYLILNYNLRALYLFWADTHLTNKLIPISPTPTITI